MAKGNCKSMNKEIAGKITSDVRGLLEIAAEVAKELNATSTIGTDKVSYGDVPAITTHTRDPTPHGSI